MAAALAARMPDEVIGRSMSTSDDGLRLRRPGDRERGDLVRDDGRIFRGDFELDIDL